MVYIYLDISITVSCLEACSADIVNILYFNFKNPSALRQLFDKMFTKLPIPTLNNKLHR